LARKYFTKLRPTNPLPPVTKILIIAESYPALWTYGMISAALRLSADFSHLTSRESLRFGIDSTNFPLWA
jgi:hypothetical protein